MVGAAQRLAERLRGVDGVAELALLHVEVQRVVSGFDHIRLEQRCVRGKSNGNLDSDEKRAEKFYGEQRWHGAATTQMVRSGWRQFIAVTI